jgi:threonine/homoserine/homoserine lactone efflux protein
MESAGIPAYALIAVLGGAAYIFWRCFSLWRTAPDNGAREHELLPGEVVLLD